jgi:hypothetical protein
VDKRNVAASGTGTTGLATVVAEVCWFAWSRARPSGAPGRRQRRNCAGSCGRVRAALSTRGCSLGRTGATGRWSVGATGRAIGLLITATGGRYTYRGAVKRAVPSLDANRANPVHSRRRHYCQAAAVRPPPQLRFGTPRRGIAESQSDGRAFRRRERGAAPASAASTALS